MYLSEAVSPLDPLLMYISAAASPARYCSYSIYTIGKIFDKGISHNGLGICDGAVIVFIS